ncbi:uncharacterized protein OCT59_001945 [Rhizophagus irregularis]|uniref:PSP proline-rich domain-containing protein n=5 Tax=Rhizophagus irregularis TaxID=588596 RepID=A0A915ZHT2_9GLOM|nr:hypothetical protein RirG_264310 [Rhizophagus irregularis DAOM 197198w]UZO10356.1 hypothetical protein OCT59_001945 [Rhizophagus irregularis]GBC47509.2 zinc finger CCHC domain-containing protein 8 [Rhizophagus irregularis DAOM 181602=DAOM 197198]CAB4481663.1 unnamed protein product [Rhizophagus irregularis]CAB5169973.1 unnamed protein product [Rhizophagus irregularis]
MEENLNQIDRVHRNHFHKRNLYYDENIQRSFPSQISQDHLNNSLPLKEANFLVKHEISSPEVSPHLHFTPYISILPQKHSSYSFKRDTIIYIDHEVTSCNKEIICEEEKNDNEAIAIIIETKNNYDDNCLINEDSIIYERITDCVLGYEEKEKDDEIETFKLNNNVDKSLIISVRKCFNCSSPYHSYYNCPLPLDEKLIKINKEKFNNEQDSKSNNGRQQFNSRYFIEYEKDFIFNIFLPGVISDVLKDALGILESEDEPPYYKRMRVYGYPPGYWGDNEGDDPLKPKKDRLSKLEEEKWNSATLKIYDNNRSDSNDSLEVSSISSDLTGNNSENDDSKDRENCLEIREGVTNNTKEELIKFYMESQKETFEKEIQGTQELQQEKKKKVPLVYYPGLNLDFAKFENRTNVTVRKTNNYNDKEQFAFYTKNTKENYVCYPTTSGWYYNGYSDWYSYEQPQPPGSTSNVPPWIISSNLELQPPPPGIITYSFGVPPPGIFTPSSDVQPPPPGTIPSLEADNSTSKFEAMFIQSQEHYKVDKSSLLWKKDDSIISKTDSFKQQQRTLQNKNVNHRNNEISYDEDCVEDMDLSD